MFIDMTQNKSKKRLLEPEIVHQIWFGIIQILLSQSKDGDKDDMDYFTPVDKKSLIEFLKTLTKNEETIFDDDKASKSIELAIEEGLITHSVSNSNRTSNGALSNGTADSNDMGDVFLITLPQKKIENLSHDYYCHECHQVLGEKDKEKLLECQHCWRCYHHNCVQTATEFINHILANDEILLKDVYSNQKSPIICPICVLTQKYSSYSVGSRHFDQEEFNRILSYTYTRFKAKASHQISHSMFKLEKNFPLPSTIDNQNESTELSKFAGFKISTQLTNGVTESNGNKLPTVLNPKDLITQLALNYLSFKSIDLEKIEDKLDGHQYKSIGEFFGDCINFRHTLELVFCIGAEQAPTIQRRIRDALTRMLEATRYELKEMIGCVDCYRNSNQQENKLWFCWPCDPPHMLVFAKQKGYPYWPAKVIYPRKNEEIEACQQLDVRFFGANHERSLIDKANIKHIDSTMGELNIIKPNPSLDKALSELKAYRELLERKVKNTSPKKKMSLVQKAKFKNSGEKSDEKKCNSSQLKNGDIVDGEKCSKNDSQSKGPDGNESKEESLECFMTEESSDTDKTEEETSVRTVTEEKEKSEDDATDIESAEEFVSKKKSVKKRGRPRKIENQQLKKSLKKSSNNELLSSSRIRKRKVIYSPEMKFDKNSSSPSDNVANAITSLSKRSRRPKELSNDLVQISSSSLHIMDSRRSQKRKNHESTVPSQTPKKRAKNETRINQTTSLQSSPSSSSSSKTSSINSTLIRSARSYQYHKRKQEIEREREEIKARRKLLHNEPLIPKHIPPVVATKSIPSTPVTPSKSTSILSRVLEAKPSSFVSSSINSQLSSPSINGFNYYNQQNQCPPYEYVTIENDISSSHLIKSEASTNIIDCPTTLASKLDSIINQENTETYSSEEYKTPSSILKPLNSEGETDEDKTDDIEESSNRNNLNENVKEQIKTIKDEVTDQNLLKNTEDDDDEEPYLYDDEQLEDHINYYTEYLKEQEQIKVEQQLNQPRFNHFYPQQPPPSLNLQQQNPITSRILMTPSHHFNSFPYLETPVKSDKQNNGFVPSFTEPLVKYIDFSSASVYAPTKKNQNLVNAYLHHVNTNGDKIQPCKNDFLAQYVLKRDEFEVADESNLSPRKRGRPPKNSESSFDHSAKAKCLLEKSYLQESSCNRACLTNNVKAFKKFREYLETQSKNEISKLKRELEETKQQVYRLTNKSNELEEMLKREQELNKKCNPAVIEQLEVRFKKEISETKKKQWCVLCEAEASFFCCFKTHYCSPQCQVKHWRSGHQSECTRNKNNLKKLLEQERRQDDSD